MHSKQSKTLLKQKNGKSIMAKTKQTNKKGTHNRETKTKKKKKNLLCADGLIHGFYFWNYYFRVLLSEVVNGQPRPNI